MASVENQCYRYGSAYPGLVSVSSHCDGGFILVAVITLRPNVMLH